ncbi:hypothetical protein OESDEN_20958 [Oesophagostomum dentatum]|uniref:Uncharacterized protein n=1 Tax=Oesophagostomum dentatum TaxID=61180 RepID=A0A0B1S673_OESDE|nr:hypothetical protein OESDEN_20958 [Oesophagostomum dentatum]
MAKTCPCRDAIALPAEREMKNSAISSRLGVPLGAAQKTVNVNKIRCTEDSTKRIINECIKADGSNIENFIENSLWL